MMGDLKAMRFFLFRHFVSLNANNPEKAYLEFMKYHAARCGAQCPRIFLRIFECMQHGPPQKHIAPERPENLMMFIV